MEITELIKRAHQNALEKGWWEEGDRNFGELLCLMHSEISEALEEYRNGRGINEVYRDEKGKPCGIPIEFADVLIRMADNCARYGIDLEDAVRQKMAYNKTRPYRHGGKRA